MYVRLVRFGVLSSGKAETRVENIRPLSFVPSARVSKHDLKTRLLFSTPYKINKEDVNKAHQHKRPRVSARRRRTEKYPRSQHKQKHAVCYPRTHLLVFSTSSDARWNSPATEPAASPSPSGSSSLLIWRSAVLLAFLVDDPSAICSAVDICAFFGLDILLSRRGAWPLLH